MSQAFGVSQRSAFGDLAMNVKPSTDGSHPMSRADTADSG